MHRSPFPWLVAQPIAHRGLHSPGDAPVENTLAAAEAAMESGLAIECDVRLSRDGDVVVFHDADLDRLTKGHGALDRWDAEDLAVLPFKRGAPGVPRLSRLLATVAGRVPLIVELKSRFDGDDRLATRVRETIADYAGSLALKSFDFDFLVALRRAGVDRPLGLVAETRFAPIHWPEVPPERFAALRGFAGLDDLQPDFLSWAVDDLPHPRVAAFRAAGRPVMTWTVRTQAQQARARDFADAIVFEGPDVRW
jgi:glycerophosphoryl diester phosphodiesterase